MSLGVQHSPKVNYDSCIMNNQSRSSNIINSSSSSSSSTTTTATNSTSSCSMADTTNEAKEDEEDFICIINEHRSTASNLPNDDTFELLEPNYPNDNNNDSSINCDKVKVNSNLLFSSLGGNSILGTKSSNISLNIDNGENGHAKPSLSTERSYSAESLNYLSECFNNNNNSNSNSTTSLNVTQREQTSSPEANNKSSISLAKSSVITSSGSGSKPTARISPTKSPPNQLATFDRLQQWIYCIAVVNFDIEIGQSIETIFPGDAHLTERESSNICYLSFPDSNSGCMGDTQFHFRTKACPVKRASFDRFYGDFNSNCLQILQVEQSYFYGYVYFRQVKDGSSRRGYFQKSLVILSWFPFVSLFSKILKVLAPQYFEFSLASLEAACSDINRWPSPITGQILSLPLLGSVTQCLIPDDKYNYASMCQSTHINLKKYSTSSLSIRSLSLLKLRKSSKDSDEGAEYGGQQQQQQQQAVQMSSPQPSRHLVVNVSNDINIYRALLPVIAHVQVLWELVLTCEPLAVITQSPNICSEVVLALVHCISPLKYGSDYRPFFTIHDSEFKEYTSQTRSPPPVILGVTNPFFVKTLADWPHLIKINDFIDDDNAKGVNMNSSLKKCPTNKSLDIKTGVYTKYKAFLVKDREILKKLLKGIESGRPMEAQNALLRRFFIELTQTFLIPLERYFASLMPLAKNLSPFKRPPILKQFKTDEFIASLDAAGPQLTTGVKGDWTGLYRRFVQSANFATWYSTRMREANDKLRALHIEAICDVNLVRQVHNRPEVEIVDLILKLKENITYATNGQMMLSQSTVDRLRLNMHNIINVLPEDSRALFGDKIGI